MLKYPEPRLAQPTYGHNLLSALPRELLARPIVHAAPEPWAFVRHHFDDNRTQLHFVSTMAHEAVKAQAERFGEASAVFGIGGGSALDHAKYTSWIKGLPLVLVPSILSVDAAYTKAIGVREGSRVRYVGAVYPEHLLIDFDLLRKAPSLLNRAGVGDILSIFTALWDWREAGLRGESYDPAVAAESRRLLYRLFAGVHDLRAMGDAGLHLLSELFVGEVRLCEMVGNARPEEGSEHYIAYCLESFTKRHYIHGQLIGLCTLLAGSIQGQDTLPVEEFLKDLDLDIRCSSLGATPQEIHQALRDMGKYVREEQQLLPGVFHWRESPSETEAKALIQRFAI